jgi:hypothetical protein
MNIKEKGRLAEGSPIPNFVLADSSEYKPLQLHLQVIRRDRHREAPSTETLWNNFCRLRLQSSAYRAVDDPVVVSAYSDWLGAFLAEGKGPSNTGSNVLPFQRRGG